MASITLNNGNKMPALQCIVYHPSDKEETTIQTVKDAIDQGCRHFYCGDGGEACVGKAINAKILEGVVKREELFITSYLRCSFFHPGIVRAALEKILASLNTPYLDLFVLPLPRTYIDHYGSLRNDECNFINFDDVMRTWPAMEDTVDLGLAKSIGTANFNGALVKRLLEVVRIRPATNTIDCDAYMPNQIFCEYLKREKITLIAKECLGSPCWHPYGAHIRLLDNPLVYQLGHKYGKRSTDILERYQLQRGHAIIVHLHYRRNHDFTISDEDIHELQTLDVGCSERLYPMAE